MYEQLAVAIVAGLLKGAGVTGTQIVADAYDAARDLLKRLVPRFELESVTSAKEQLSVETLVTRLQGNTPQENAELAAAFSGLAVAMGGADEKNVFDRVVDVQGISAAYDINVDLKGGAGSKDRIRDVSSKYGNVNIKSETIQTKL